MGRLFSENTTHINIKGAPISRSPIMNLYVVTTSLEVDLEK